MILRRNPGKCILDIALHVKWQHEYIVTDELGRIGAANDSGVHWGIILKEISGSLVTVHKQSTEIQTQYMPNTKQD